MSKNPFGQLAIRRDDDDEEVGVAKPTLSQQSTNVTVGSTVSDSQQKKKKVRPEEKAKLEEIHRQDVEEEGGFQVIQKKPTKGRPLNANLPETLKETDRKPKNKGAYLERNDKDFGNPKRRVFDRHSGTGRGKEIAKGGSGGHHTWGNNPRNIAKENDGGNEYLHGRDEDQCKLYLLIFRVQQCFKGEETRRGET
jgi:hypothetical protein